MIIDRADMFGLSQLYQLRGRVGRSRERAYCYLIVPPANAMTDEARSRIEALERYTEQLGFPDCLSRSRAPRLRRPPRRRAEWHSGLGRLRDVLSDAREAVHELRQGPVIRDVDPELSFDADALCLEDYISDVGVRLSLQSASPAPARQDVRTSPPRWEDRWPPPPRRAGYPPDADQDRAAQAPRPWAAGDGQGVTLHLRDDTPSAPPS